MEHIPKRRFFAIIMPSSLSDNHADGYVIIDGDPNTGEFWLTRTTGKHPIGDGPVNIELCKERDNQAGYQLAVIIGVNRHFATISLDRICWALGLSRF